MNQRTIKFRAWDKHPGVQEMIYHGSIENWLMKPETYVVMQFTGLLDKHGKEIYEGDIVNNPSFRKGVVVELIEGTFEPFSQGDYGWTPSISEVIGNIWENPDLLTPKTQ